VADPADGRQRIPALSPFEEEIGYTRALRAGKSLEAPADLGGRKADEQRLRPARQRLAEQRHATVVTYSAMVHESLRAAADLSREGWEIEVLDLRPATLIKSRDFH